jgi:predicted RNA methylase
MVKEILTERHRVSNIFTEDVISLINNKKILDLGAHQGYFSNLALSYGAKSSIAIEKIKESCDIGKGLFPEVNFVNLDLEDQRIFEYVEESEVVFCFAILYLLENQKELFKKISDHQNIKSVVVDYPYHEIDTIKKYDDCTYDIMSINNIEQMFKDAGFEILVKNKYDLQVENKYMKPRISFLLHRK